MIEVVFNDSACGSLKAAQHYGEGNYIGGCTGVIISWYDGSQPTAEEISAAQMAAEEQNRLEWERAVPMGGNSQDVFGFHLMLSMGDISNNNFAYTRQKAIEHLWSIYPDISSDTSFDMISNMHQSLKTIRDRVSQGEQIRIWYSSQPDELCGLYWFMSELQQFERQPKTVYLVKLPEHESKENHTVIAHSSWGEIPPGEWGQYTSLAEVATPVFCRHLAVQWHALQNENAPLRVVLNGHLIGASERIYDEFIVREIDEQSAEFQEAVVIGRVLGKYQLGIGDVWIAHRIEKMIDNGILSIVSSPAKDMPIYHRRLRKNNA